MVQIPLLQGRVRCELVAAAPSSRLVLTCNSTTLILIHKVGLFSSTRLTPSRHLATAIERLDLSSRPEDSHLRALPDPYVNLSIHTAPDVRPFPWQSCQWAKSVGFARRSRSNQSRAPLVLRRNRLNLRRAQRMT